MPVLTPRRGRRSLVAAASLALGSSLALLPAPAAHAAGTPFIVIGTSDVSDSNLVASVIEPRFEAQYPQYDLQYVAKGTGAAITDARAGLGAALIVHAASIENQFVGDGYSLEAAGRLVFWGDYVLAGPLNDPAGVLSGGATDVVTAFEKVAAAGALGQASFVTRGGTPGTAVQERAIWALSNVTNLCAVGNPSGGGKRPTDGSSTLCTLPDDKTGPDGAPFPTWYNAGSSASQAANVVAASTCSSGPFPNGKCYVFTDRGTLKYLQSTGVATNLKVLTRDNSSSARGGRDALINVFHAYGVNPAKFPNPATTKTDATAAKLFLDFLTSPATQTAIGQHLAADGDSAFIPSAAPKLTGAFGQSSITSGDALRVSGNLSQVVPGYPALSGVPVNLLEATSNSPLAIPKVVGTATTDASGNYAFNQVLTAGMHYRVGVGAITKTQIATLSPPFSSILAPTTTNVGTVAGVELGKVKKNKSGHGKFKVKAKLLPAAPADSASQVTLYAAKKGGKFKKIGQADLPIGASSYTFQDKLGKGKWKLQVVYESPGFVDVTSKTVKVTLP